LLFLQKKEGKKREKNVNLSFGGEKQMKEIYCKSGIQQPYTNTIWGVENENLIT